MIKHVVLLKPRAEVTEKQIDLALQHVMALKEEIAGITAVVTGKNLSQWHQGYTYGFIMEFPDVTLLGSYAAHPAHQPVSQELQSLCESIIDFDL